MVKIVRIKFDGNDKLYDYFCDIKDVGRGDLVFVEGCEEPVFVYETAKVNKRDTSATKNVIGLAEENPNVHIKHEYMDITKCDCSCIVNYLNNTTARFGKLCSTIITSANSQEISDMIKDNPEANYFDTFITDAGDLPSKHIIHIVLPHKNDDKYNKNLKILFHKVIDLAIKKRYKSIGIPYTDVSMLGYDENDIKRTLDNVMFEYQFKKDIKIDIHSIYFDTNPIEKYGILNKKYRRNRSHHHSNKYNYTMNGGYYDDCEEESYFNIEGNRNAQIKWLYQDIYRYYDSTDEIYISQIEKPFDFVECYMYEKGYSKTKNMRLVFGYYENGSSKYADTRKNIIKGKRKLTKQDIYRLAIAGEMNFTQIIQFLTISGYCFNPQSLHNIDFEIFNYITNENGFPNSNKVRSYFGDVKYKDIYNVLFENEDDEVIKVKI